VKKIGDGEGWDEKMREVIAETFIERMRERWRNENSEIVRREVKNKFYTVSYEIINK
jgi:hypothetical protein